MDIQYLDHLADTDNQIIHRCAKLYCEIWREPPWEESWDKEVVVRDIKSQLMIPNAKIILALYNEDVIGFTWGYQISRNRLRKISRNKNLDFIFKDKVEIYYIDELGVSVKHRGYGIGMELANKLLSLIPANINAIILRTDKDALPARKIYAELGFTELNILDSKYPSRSYWLKKIM